MNDKVNANPTEQTLATEIIAVSAPADAMLVAEAADGEALAFARRRLGVHLDRLVEIPDPADTGETDPCKAALNAISIYRSKIVKRLDSLKKYIAGFLDTAECTDQSSMDELRFMLDEAKQILGDLRDVTAYTGLEEGGVLEGDADEEREQAEAARRYAENSGDEFLRFCA